MKIYCPHSSGFDYANDFYKPILASPAAGKHQFILPHVQGAEPVNSKVAIESCDLVLAEVSYPSTGLGIELGWANAAGKTIWAIHRHDKPISSSIKIVAHEIHPYQSMDEILQRL